MILERPYISNNNYTHRNLKAIKSGFQPSFGNFKDFKVAMTGSKDTFKSVFDYQEQFTLYRKNNYQDNFLKNYLFNSCNNEKINIPDDFKIDVYSLQHVSHSTQLKLRKLVFGEFHGYLHYFVDLMGKKEADFNNSLKGFKLPETEKDELKSIYNYLNTFYKVKVKFPGSEKTCNLLTLSDKEKREIIQNSSPENKDFTKHVLNKSDELKELAFKFSRSEIERLALFKVGEGSRIFISKLLGGILLLEGVDKFAKPELVKGLGGLNTAIGGSANKLTEFVAGGLGDVLGGYRDTLQDEVILGKDTAKKIFNASVPVAFMTSALAAKVGVGTLGGSILYGNAASGSSIFSNIAIFSIMYKNFDRMLDKGIIKLPEKNMSALEKFNFKLKTVWNNFKAYDVYLGNVLGVLASTPAAIIAFKCGAFKSKVWKTTALILVASMETYITSLVQLYRDNARRAKINASKELIEEYHLKPDNYDFKNLEVTNVSSIKQFTKAVKNFAKTFL